MNKGNVLLILLALGLAGCQHNTDPPNSSRQDSHQHAASPSSADTVDLSAEAREMAGIKMAKVEPRTCHCVLKAMGKVLAPPARTAVVGHAFPARVAAIHVAVGDWVEKQQPLLTLESYEVGSAKSEFYKTLADLELAKLTLAREQRLLEEGIGVKKNHLAAQTAYEIAQLNAEAAEKKLHVLGFNESQVKEIAKTHQISPTITLYAPIAGKVISDVPVLGTLIDESSEILQIIDTTALWVNAEIYEKDLAKVRVGQRVDIVVPAYPATVFQGKLSYIGDVVDPETRTITVRAEVNNADHRLKPGMFANVTIHLNGDCKSLAIPVAAVLEEGDQRFVFVLCDSHFVRRKVETGAIEDAYQQITEGLEHGEEVVVQGNHLLRSKLLEAVLHQAHHTH